MTSLYGAASRPGQSEATAEAIFEDKKVKISLAVSFFKVYNQKNYTKKDIVAFYLSELLIAMQTLLYFLANSMY